MMYADMSKKMKELEDTIYILESQRKTVIHLNPNTGTFEYIGEPLHLDRDIELKTVEEIIQSMKDWLARPTNDRLSVKQIFESLDKEGYGELTPQNFESALNRLGIRPRPGELQILGEILDQRKLNFLNYRRFVRELQGVPQLDFMSKGIIKMAQIAETGDLTNSQFLDLIDPQNTTMMYFENFKQSIQLLKK